MLRNYFVSLVLVLFMVGLPGGIILGEDWPCWRGVRGDGTCVETGMPLHWSADENVVWKSEVPGVGHASPIVCGDYVFTATALMESEERLLLCYDRKTGKEVWRQCVVKAPLEKKHGDNSYASGSPAADGKQVYVTFMDGNEVVVVAYDFAGKKVWEKRPGTFESPHGYSCTPIFYKDTILINGCSKEKSFIVALRCKDGETVWRGGKGGSGLSYSSPFIRNMCGRDQMIFCAEGCVTSYDPVTGEMIWRVDGPSDEFCSTPVYHEEAGLVIISSSWPKRIVMGIRPDGKGDVTKTHVVWESKVGAHYVPSPIAVGKYVFTTMPNGIVCCIQADTGEVLWKEKVGRQYASGVLCEGLVYMPNDEGVVTVIRPGDVFEKVAENAIGEKMFASPAFSNGQIFLRGEKHLFCIGKD